MDEDFIKVINEATKEIEKNVMNDMRKVLNNRYGWDMNKKQFNNFLDAMIKVQEMKEIEEGISE